MTGAYVAGAVSCLAQLGIPDLLEAAPKSVEELAQEIGADPRALYRLMRATASVGVLSEGPDGKFSQTPMSAVLRSNATPSLRSWTIMGGRRQARCSFRSTALTRTTAIVSNLYPGWYWAPLERWGVSSEHDYVLSNVSRRSLPSSSDAY
jgi:hypothetical protein